MLLAAVGIYSVLAYSVRQRVKEIGVRIALGAQLADVLRLVILEGMKPTALGLGIGVVGLADADPRVGREDDLWSEPARYRNLYWRLPLLGMIALLATLVPAWRATRVDPMRTLRDE